MKIAIAAPTSIPARRANTIQVMKMAQAMVVLGHEVRLAAPAENLAHGNLAKVLANSHSDAVAQPSQGLPQTLVHQYGLQHSFPIQWLESSPHLRRWDYGSRVVRWARDWGADLLYTRLPQAAALSSLLGLGTILEMHDFPQGQLGPSLFRGFLRGRGARRLVAITRSLAEDLSRAFRVPLPPLTISSTPFLVIAPDGVDLPRYTCLPGPREARLALPSLQDKGFIAGYSGHLYPGRGVDLILEAATRLPEITFLLVGGDPQDVRRVQSIAGARGLSNVLLAGFVPNAELPAYQAACDVLLMPYQRQVAASSGGDIARYLSPMKLFEYLACGRPILSSDLPVLRETVNEENAVLLPPEDTNAWVEALLALQGDPGRRAALSQAARLSAGQYTWEARANKILDGL
jgi:glycosyltransferase involved in cell wall biosynthesis